MPLATDEEVAEFIRDHGPIRLGCRNCDIEDYDGVRLLPGDWQDIEEVQSLRDAISVFERWEDDCPRGYSSLDWWTHLGYCPKCVLAGANY